MRRRELLAERQPHVFHIAARAVDQDDGGFGAGRAARQTELRHVQPRALDVDEAPGGRMRSLDPGDPERRHGDEHTQHDGKHDEESCGRHNPLPELHWRR